MVDLGTGELFYFFFNLHAFFLTSKQMGLCTSPKQRLPERFISILFLCFFVYSIEGQFCYTPQNFFVHFSALFHFSFQVANLIITPQLFLFSPSYANMKTSGQTFCLWTLLSFFLCLSCCSRLARKDESCLSNIFKQPRVVYHNQALFTAAMCACAQFSVVVFWRGLWHRFIGCSRCTFVCKCIYLYRNVCICIPRKYLCAF